MPQATNAGREDRLYQEGRLTSSLKPARRDAERILFSPAFRRLGAVTQVIGVDENNVFRNRLSHSLQVARTAHDLAQHLSYAQSDLAEELKIDPDVTEAAGLAHDLGHPPFGHVGEEELNELVTQNHDLDGFEGNAQSFRIVTKLEVASPKDPKCTYEETCFYSAHTEMTEAEQIATALLQLRNNPALFDRWAHQCGLAFKADGQVFTRAQ